MPVHLLTPARYLMYVPAPAFVFLPWTTRPPRELAMPLVFYSHSDITPSYKGQVKEKRALSENVSGSCPVVANISQSSR